MTPEGTEKTLEQIAGLLNDESNQTKIEVPNALFSQLPIEDKKYLICKQIEELSQEGKLVISQQIDQYSEERAELVSQLEIEKNSRDIIEAEVEADFADNADYELIDELNLQITQLQNRIARLKRQLEAKLKAAIAKETIENDKAIAAIEGKIDRIDKLIASLEAEYQAGKPGVPCCQ